MELPGHALHGHGGLYNGHTTAAWRIAGCDVTFALYLNRGFVDQRQALNRLLPVLTRAADGSSSCGPRSASSLATP